MTKATIEMENGSTIELALDEENAPITVANFVELANTGFYDGLGFHRIIKDFMIQGGDPNFNCTGGSDKNIKGEFISNGINNTILHKRGVISMARSADPDSASSQFFICHADVPRLDREYAAFGHVVAGMDTVDAIASVETLGPEDHNGPLVPQIIRHISIS